MLASDMPDIRIAIGAWGQLGPDARAIRHEVFVVEQHVSEEEEWDSEDQPSTHAVAYDGSGAPVGTGRLLPNGYIGRMAVRTGMRGSGIGARILETLMEEARSAGHRANPRAWILYGSRVQTHR